MAHEEKFCNVLMSLNCHLTDCAIIILTGTCAAMNYKNCCTPGTNASLSCHGSDGVCFCDQSCHLFGDCCTDIEQYCPSGIVFNNDFLYSLSLLLFSQPIKYVRYASYIHCMQFSPY